MTIYRMCSGVPGGPLCGKLISTGYKCDECRRKTERDKSRRRRRTPKERTRRQTLIQQHVAIYGWVCPGFECEPHPSRDLTADHILPVAQGGQEEGEIRVLCRSCNARRGDGRGGGASRTRGKPPIASLSRNKLLKRGAPTSKTNRLAPGSDERDLPILRGFDRVQGQRQAANLL